MGDDIRIDLLKAKDLPQLLAVQPGLFDGPILPEQSEAFLNDANCLLLLAYDRDLAVGLCSGTVLRHPDKPPALFVNELGTRDSHQRKGIATALMARMLSEARRRGLKGVWLGTESDNHGALAFYRSLKADEFPGVYFGWDGAFDEDQS